MHSIPEWRTLAARKNGDDLTDQRVGMIAERAAAAVGETAERWSARVRPSCQAQSG